MRAIAALVVPMVLLTGKLAVVHAGDGGDGDKIQGSWIVSAGEKAGREAPAEGLKDVRMTFNGGKFTWRAGGKETRGTFSLDATRSPGEISMHAEDKTLAGIYRIDGGELKICVGIGDDRPTEFAAKAGARALLLVLKREKP